MLLLLTLLAESEKNWLNLASRCSKELTTGKWRDTHTTANDWLAHIANQANTTVNTLKRQMRVAEFLQAEVNGNCWNSLLQSPPSFPSLELVQRLLRYDRKDEDKKILNDVLAGNLTFREVRALLNARSVLATAGGRRLIAMRSKQFEVMASDQLKQQQSIFLGGVPADTQVAFEEFRNSLPLGFLRPDVLAVGRKKQSKAVSFISAFEIQFLNSEDKRQGVARTLQKAALMEKFFNQIWFLFPAADDTSSHMEEYYHELAMRLIELDMDSVGLVHMPESKEGDEDDKTPVFRKISQFNASPKSQKALVNYL